ncbi:unnamed protein product [Vicia faba]|uniref:Uncharacterized protein n=1 Tax=Vicia faba TaxID=3906 RepID=A0AAV0ZC75_VICFA|nr:unnamed protein product [Vicia faba]
MPKRNKHAGSKFVQSKQACKQYTCPIEASMQTIYAQLKQAYRKHVPNRSRLAGSKLVQIETGLQAAILSKSKGLPCMGHLWQQNLIFKANMQATYLVNRKVFLAGGTCGQQTLSNRRRCKVQSKRLNRRRCKVQSKGAESNEAYFFLQICQNIIFICFPPFLTVFF